MSTAFTKNIMESQKLRALMDIHKINPTQLGKSIGVTRQTVHYWRNERVPRCWHKVLENHFIELATQRIVKDIDKENEI